MNKKEMLALVKTKMTEHRYVHTLGVVQTSIDLAERFGADVEKAEIAAIFHDYAKFRPKDEMRDIITSQKMDPRLLEHNEELWHAPVGAYLVKSEAGIDDAEILDAIRYHTSGRKNMTLLEKVVYLADYIEPGRHFQGVEEVRELAKSDLNGALIQSIKNTITFLMKRNQAVFPDTVDTYNDLINRKAGV
ncbi:bis(5'-nucleosyl)-tetraphosphatase (symmetrical) YqeK [Falsibacillus pallidus]|uniref:bis(5'-nucleosyl)-tetraphosphatase (symmetrical) n=1 Tax=Falsibacillus pallidus TaxID=493781 RepID=A0A370GK71_9BACI|nr:bis(5'-nucleosyl)-tetraphosphatase (symmetrical) YqeK [Falsibacillus pallidus]RDI44037.1 putative HD superfamily hydrolase involved in NAD metabolism [Falsibacillus pallidus]